MRLSESVDVKNGSLFSLQLDIYPHTYIPTPGPNTRCPLCRLPLCSPACRAARVVHTAAECAVFARARDRKDSKDSDLDLAEDSGVLASVTAARLLRLRAEAPEVWARVDWLMDNIECIRCDELSE